MTAIKIGYARVSTDGQDRTAQRQALSALSVPPDRVYVDHGITGTHRERPGLRDALAACRTGDTLVVTKLDRLGRQVEMGEQVGAAGRGSSWSSGRRTQARSGRVVREAGPAVTGDHASSSIVEAHMDTARAVPPGHSALLGASRTRDSRHFGLVPSTPVLEGACWTSRGRRTG